MATGQDMDGTGDPAARWAVMALCAAATGADLAEALAGLDARADDLRPPETGLVMARGRIGGDGSIGLFRLSRGVVFWPWMALAGFGGCRPTVSGGVGWWGCGTRTRSGRCV